MGSVYLPWQQNTSSSTHPFRFRFQHNNRLSEKKSLSIKRKYLKAINLIDSCKPPQAIIVISPSRRQNDKSEYPENNNLLTWFELVFVVNPLLHWQLFYELEENYPQHFPLFVLSSQAPTIDWLRESFHPIFISSLLLREFDGGKLRRRHVWMLFYFWFRYDNNSTSRRKRFSENGKNAENFCASF